MINAFITRKTTNKITIIFNVIRNSIKVDGNIEVGPGQSWEGYSFEELRLIDININPQIPLPK